MMLMIYNSLSRKKERFVPITPQEVKLYVCGMTVYDDCHLGHARSMVSFDAIVRYLRAEGYRVTFVRNITDIDDKIIQRANERNIPIKDLTDQYIQSMHNDMAALQLLAPEHEPRATDYCAAIVDLIQVLYDKGYAYQTDSGDICYAVHAFSGYGKLSHKDLEGLMAGARVEVTHDKRSPLDFVLWKKAKPSEPSWPSPWGEGRPGWHIECSAMAMNVLGQHFDIHGGGLDLQFPHHENEIAQSEAASDKPFANYWLHVGMLQVNAEKMSKSLGNFLTIKDALAMHEPEVLRYFLLSSHYRSPLNYSSDNLRNAKKALLRLYQCIQEPWPEEIPLEETWVHAFKQAMNDDFNTPKALSVLFQLSHEINKTKQASLRKTLFHLSSILGLLASPLSFSQETISEATRLDIEALIEERLQAKKQKNWAKADTIRDELVAQGIQLEDNAEGTLWRYIDRS